MKAILIGLVLLPMAPTVFTSAQEAAPSQNRELATLSGRVLDIAAGHGLYGIAVARAIVRDPNCFLFDEPLSRLDVELRHSMRGQIKEVLSNLSKATVIVTHDQLEALTMADRIAVMRDGSIVQLGSGEDIYRNPATRYVADFIGEANLLACMTSPDGIVSVAPDGPVLPYDFKAVSSGEVSLMVRPEDVLVGGAVGADEVTLPATLKDKVFVGSTWRLFLAVAGGQEIAAEPGYSIEAERLAVGETTTVRWRRDAARLLVD
jgi:ABC-type Fe3+/spermidine/putrescine transport system ATPase subunit